MISSNFLVNADGKLLGFHIKGHSGSGFFGNDIVCAAVSSAAFMVVNTITDVLNADANVSVLEDGEMTFKIDYKYVDLCRDIMEGFKLHMKGLEEQYPENIKVNYVEV